MVCHPDVGSVKGNAVGLVSHGKSALQSAIAGPQLGQVVAANVCHPDVSSIKGDAFGDASNAECCGQIRSPLEQCDLQRVEFGPSLLRSRWLHQKAADAE